MPGENRQGHFLDQNLDPRLVDVVSSAEPVVDPQDRVEVVEHLLPGEELADHVPDDGRASHAAADQNPKSDLAVGVPHRMNADVVHQRCCAIVRRAAYRDLEFARQIRELGMERRPLPEQLRVGARVDELVPGDAGEVIRGDVAHAVAAGLNGVHLNARELCQNVRHVLEPGPVELDVLTCGEVAVASVILAADVRQLAQLRRGQQSVRDRDAKHRSVLLDVQAVLEAQRPKFVFGQFARQKAPRLVAKLRDAFVDKALIDVVVLVHVVPLGKAL